MSDSLNIGFIGLGLIGGSIAKSLKRFHPQTRIFAYTRTEATLDLAVSEGIVDVKCTKEYEAFASCNYIFLSRMAERSYEPGLYRYGCGKCKR